MSSLGIESSDILSSGLVVGIVPRWLCRRGFVEAVASGVGGGGVEGMKARREESHHFGTLWGRRQLSARLIKP
jgi:hypothetical protein